MLKVRRPSTLVLLLPLFIITISANGRNKQIGDFVKKHNKKHLKFSGTHIHVIYVLETADIYVLEYPS